MAAPVLNGVDKLPYVRLERLNDGAQPPVDHTQRIPLADRDPVVLLQRLPLDLPEDNVGGGENQSLDGPLPPPVPSVDQDDGGDSTSDGRKRSLTPPPFTPSTSGTPSKRVRFSSGGSGGLSARRQLWTRLQHETVTPILKPKSSATKENLSVLLGVKSSRGVPIVSLERLKLSGGLLTGSLARESRPSCYNEDTDVEEETSAAGSSSSKNGEPTGRGRRAATSSCGYQQTDSSDDNCMQRCKYCRQCLSDVQTAVLPSSSLQESDLLRRPEFLGESGGDQPACRASEIQVYDRSQHLTPMDAPKTLFRKGLYLSARVAPVWDEEGQGILCNNIGPLTSWWLTGYGSGEKPVIGVSTGLADYYIQGEHAAYADFFRPLWRKMHLAKLAVDAVNDDPSCSYESLVRLIQEAAVPGLDAEQEGGFFTEEELLKHGPFVVQQACSHDAARDRDEEPTALTAPCIQQLVNLCRVKKLE